MERLKIYKNNIFFIFKKLFFDSTSKQFKNIYKKLILNKKNSIFFDKHDFNHILN
jgi:hypothetical protein